MVVLASGPKLTVDDLPLEVQDSRFKVQSQAPTAQPSTTNDQLPTTNSTLASSERTQILAALERCHGNKSKAADELGISRRTIHRKLKEWGIS